MKKANVSKFLLTLFGVGMLLALFAGGASVLGYIAALFIGGKTATAICAFIFKTYLPFVIKATSAFAGIGLIGMYLTRQKALSVKNEK